MVERSGGGEVGEQALQVLGEAVEVGDSEGAALRVAESAGEVVYVDHAGLRDARTPARGVAAAVAVVVAFPRRNDVVVAELAGQPPIERVQAPPDAVSLTLGAVGLVQAGRGGEHSTRNDPQASVDDVSEPQLVRSQCFRVPLRVAVQERLA